MKRVVLGTAGHIDHGKTALVRALTGIDTDRLREEKRRGITIELGFAHLALPDGTVAGVVDVPGHERLVAEIGRLAAEVPERPADGPVFLPVDRAFSMKGFGTVVTGTLVSGQIGDGDEAALLPPSP